MRVRAPKYKSGCLPVSRRPAVLSRNCPTQKREIYDESFGFLISNASTPSLYPPPHQELAHLPRRHLSCRIQTFSILKPDFPQILHPDHNYSPLPHSNCKERSTVTKWDANSVPSISPPSPPHFCFQFETP
ncbi:hypothetical protein CEXT_502811 [Caerostris extrusa]|uniref:Uncharacterized protein n=1 Tax=Caerostris extrusa TaxID=172846 RepID=A0AAV4MFA1_CAEEX|nr:hypothetical protein CEXT_502811 [Caerostris extrusa]